jgi:hypothetical protein
MHNHSSFTDEHNERQAAKEENGRERQGEELRLSSEAILRLGDTPAPLFRRPTRKKQLTLIAVVVALLLAGSALLLPILLAQPAQLASPSHPVTAVTRIGRVFFTSSGQLTPTSSEGLNDVVHLELAGLEPPAPGKSDYAWLLPDASQNEQQPVLLGTLHIQKSSAQLT